MMGRFVPLMSENCWETVVAALHRGRDLRCLEWGSGNSTLAAAQLMLESGSDGRSELVSVEHDHAYYLDVLQQMVDLARELGRQGTIEIAVSPPVSWVEWRRAHRRSKDLECHVLKWLWLSGNKSYLPAGKELPDFSFGLRRTFHRGRSLARAELAFLLEGWRSLVARDPDPVPARIVLDSGQPFSSTGAIGIVPRRVRTTLILDRCRIHYHCLPPLKNFLSGRQTILDGLYIEFFSYVDLALTGTFDVILIDGRARTSCIRRVHEDSLLSPGGIMFVHDADRVHHHEGYQLFDRYEFVTGSNVKLDGSVLYPRAGVVLPLVASGDRIAELRVRNDRELFLYRRAEDRTRC